MNARFNAVPGRQVGPVRVRLRCKRGPIMASPDAIYRPIFSPITEAQSGKLTSSIQAQPTLEAHYHVVERQGRHVEALVAGEGWSRL